MASGARGDTMLRRRVHVEKNIRMERSAIGIVKGL
jgi:hypothetical protein